MQAGRGPARDSVLLGKYQVDSPLGFGGMGLVIKAKNLDLNEYVAIKLLREDVQVDEENVIRFLREAKNAVKLKSEHVARIHDVGTFEDGRPFMVMELLEGLDLGKLLLDQGAVDRGLAVDLVLQACDAIAEAHSLGIVHRDIKPTNLFVTRRRDGSELLKVLDFGISKATLGPDMSLTQTQSMLGTPAYMSPEQMRSARTVDRRSDIWSLGCVLYELVEGHSPFEAENFAELCVMVAIEPFIPLARARELGPVIDRVLTKKVEDRYQDVAELALALEPYASDPEAARRQVARVFRVLGRSHPDGRDSTPMSLDRRRPSQPRLERRDSTPASPDPRRPSQPHLERRDSTPASPDPRRPSQPRLESNVSYPALPQTPAPSFVIESSSRWKMFALLGLVCGVGIAAGLLFLDTNERQPQPTQSEDIAEPAGSSEVNEMTIERGDAAIVGERSDAAIGGAVGGESGGAAGESGGATAVTDIDAGVRATQTITKLPPKPHEQKSPPRKPPPPRKLGKATPPKRAPAKPPNVAPPKPPPPATPPAKKCDPFDNPNGCH